MATLEEVQAKSAPVISRIANEAMRLGALALVELSYKGGVEIRITHGLRTMAEQQALYNQGRTAASKAKGEKVVTNALPGYSYHNFGLGIDFVLLKGGYDMKYDGDADGIADWVEVVTIAKELGFEWGGDWKSFKDYPHFQMNFGLTTAQLRSGRTPSISQVSNNVSKIKSVLNSMFAKEEGKEMEQLTKKFEEFKKATEEVLKAQDEKIKALEKQNKMPVWAPELLGEMKNKGLITTSADKGYQFSTIAQMLKNAGFLEQTFIDHVASVNAGK